MYLVTFHHWCEVLLLSESNLYCFPGEVRRVDATGCPLSSSIHHYVKHPAKVAMTIQIQLLIHTFGPLHIFFQCLNICMIWNAFASWYIVCAILLYILCTSGNCPLIKWLLPHLYGNGGVLVLNWNEKGEKKKKVSVYHLFRVFVVIDSALIVVNIVLHVTTRW